MLKLLIFSIIFLSSLQSFQVRLADELPTKVQRGDITRVDIILTNSESKGMSFINKIDSDRSIIPLINGQTFTIAANSQQVLSFYLKIDPTIAVGVHEVTFRFYNSTYNYYVIKQLIIESSDPFSWLRKTYRPTLTTSLSMQIF